MYDKKWYKNKGTTSSTSKTNGLKQTEVQEHFQTYKYGKFLVCLDLVGSLHVHCNNLMKRFLLDRAFKIKPTLLAKI